MPLSPSSVSVPYRVLHFETLDSTNAEAMRRAEAGEAGPLWIVSDTQTAGRGRSGRCWASDSGNLHASLLVRLRAPAPKAYQLSLVAGVAAVDAVREAMTPAPGALRLKWPNDILVGAAKTGGILVESTARPDGVAAVIGIGINLAAHPEGLDRPATHLGAHGTAPEPSRLLAHLAAATGRWLEIWAEGDGFAAVREAWLGRAGPIGEQLRINAGGETVEGAFGGLDADGALLLHDAAGRQRHFTFGDVSLAR